MYKRQVITSAQAIVSRRQNISKLPVVVSFGAIKGGIRYNIIPDQVELIGTIRTCLLYTSRCV